MCRNNDHKLGLKVKPIFVMSHKHFAKNIIVLFWLNGFHLKLEGKLSKLWEYTGFFGTRLNELGPIQVDWMGWIDLIVWD